MVRDAAAAEHLAQALNTINRARGLTGQLLTFAKGGAPVKKFDRLTPLIQDTVKFALSGSNVSSYFTIAADLWQCEFDRSQISQTIDNIVLNGMQAMPEGGVIEIKAENIEIAKETPGTLCAGNYVKIAIKDHGIGMPKAILPKIFDPFFTTKAKGHGLGLATCHSIITRHGGAIEADSEPGKGSTLTIYLPASRQAGPTDAPNFVVPHKGGGLFLVMDDEAIIRETLRALLGRFGYTVSCASNAKEALELFEQRRREGNPFTALMMDLTIPGGPGGKEAILEIRKIDKNIPVFVSSGYADDPVMARPEAYGFTASICKPFMGGELAEMLNRHLGKASMAFPAT
jgi:CheY-like chemotaxis protein